MLSNHPQRFLTSLPVYNEVDTVNPVLDQVLRYSPHVLVVDDGSTDGTSELLAQRDDIQLMRHEPNRGYGAALRTAFAYAQQHGYEIIVTIDCDGQHEPQRIPGFVDACEETGADIVSGSRYLKHFNGDSTPPADRRRVNERITGEVNRRLDLALTDAFCGFKAYRTQSLTGLHLTEDGYAMPLELWVQAACRELSIIELPVPLIYLDEKRSFGGALDKAAIRMEYYHLVLDRAVAMAKEVAPAGSRCAGAVG